MLCNVWSLRFNDVQWGSWSELWSSWSLHVQSYFDLAKRHQLDSIVLLLLLFLWLSGPLLEWISVFCNVLQKETIFARPHSCTHTEVYTTIFRFRGCIGIAWPKRPWCPKGQRSKFVVGLLYCHVLSCIVHRRFLADLSTLCFYLWHPTYFCDLLWRKPTVF